MQQAFIQLAKQDCPAIENKEAWLVRVCRNGALKALSRDRRAAFRPEVFWENVPDEQADGGSDTLVHREHVGLLFSKLEELPEKQREVIRLHYLGGMKADRLPATLRSIHEREVASPPPLNPPHKSFYLTKPSYHRSTFAELDGHNSPSVLLCVTI